MTMKPFEIQSTALSIGGVKIDTSATGTLVLPGVTRAGSSVAIEVNDTQDQTVTWTGTPVVIDGYTYAVYITGEANGLIGWNAATYSIDQLDGEGYIDGISVVSGGSNYTGEAVTFSQVMYAANEGTQIDSSTNGQWVEIPFSVRCGAGSIESEFGGGGASNLYDLNDVSIDGPNAGQVLTWNGQSEQWENQNLPGGSGSSGDRITSPNSDYEAVIDDNGTLGIANGSFLALNTAGGGYSTIVDGDGINMVWNGEQTGNIAKGPGGFSLNADSSKSVFVNTDSMNNSWEFTSSGGLKFPDNTTQTTAYTGQVAGNQPLYIMANIDGTILTSTDGVTWAGPFNSGVEGINRVEIHGSVIVYALTENGPFTGTGLYYSTEVGVATLCSGTDSLLGDNLYWNELHHITETDKWVAVGYASGTNRYPVIAHSTNGISWTVQALDLTTYSNINPSNNNWVFNDVIYSTADSAYVIIGSMTNGYSGVFVTSDITVPLNETNYVPVQANLYEIIKWNVEQYGGPAGYMVAMSDDNGQTLWATATPVNDPNSWSAQGDGSNGWWENSFLTAINYIPEVAEMTYNYSNFLVTTGDGQIMTPGLMGPGYITVPLPYTLTEFSINNSSSAAYTIPPGGATPTALGEKITITNSNPSSYNGTYYVGADQGGSVFPLCTDGALQNGFDTSAMDPFVSGTITYSHGTYFDAAGVDGNGYYFIGNDDEQVFRSTDGGQTWTEMADVDGVYFNDFAYGLFGSATSNGAELIGDGATGAIGQTRVIGTNFEGYQGGESTSLVVNSNYANGFNVGDTIVFRNGEIRTITLVNPDAWNDGGSATVFEWAGEVGGEWPTNPRYPVTVTSSNYVPATKNTARIKPDSTLADIGQYMEIYTGGAPVLDDTGHIHMKGHTGNVELFLGTDDNYVSVKESGSMPASVKLHSENKVTVIESDLRLSRNGSWVSVYGDGENHNRDNNGADIAHDIITSDQFGDYYVGGEHCWNADAYISKYSRDGSLIWNKINNSNDIGGWVPMAISHHGDEVAALVRTNSNRDNWYVKLITFNSETGDIKATNDIYDGDNSIYAYDMIYHSTLGWTVVGENNGEVGSVTNVAGIGNTGVGIIEVSGASSMIDGRYPQYSNDWTISGTNISGEQSLNYRAVGLYRDMPVTSITGSGTGGRLDIRCEYNNNNWWYNYQNEGTGASNAGSGYAAGDLVKIPGSLLGGINNMPVSGLGSINPTSIDGTYYLFDKVTFPTLNTDVHVGDFVVDNTTSKIVVVTNAPDTYWNDSSLWAVSVYIPYGGLDTPAGDVTFTRGNDFMGAVNSDGSFNGVVDMFGIVAHDTIRIDMSDLGYTTDDFTGGTFTFSKKLNSRPFIWNSSWAMFIEPPSTNNSNPSGFAKCVAEDTWDGGYVVGGYLDNGTNSGSLVWKLNSSGTTTWSVAIVDDDNDINSIAVSPVDGSIYATTRWTALSKFNSSGILLQRVTDDYNVFWLNDPVVTIQKDNFGVEQILVGGRGDLNSIGSFNSGLLVTKLTTDLDVIWSRHLCSYMSSLNTNYNYTLKNVEFNHGQATIVGYRRIPNGNYDRGLMYTMDTSDSFTSIDTGDWVVRVVDARWVKESPLSSTFDLITAGGSSANSSIIVEWGTQGLSWNNWTYQSTRYNLNTQDQLVEGVGGIRFSDGGLLDHNPVDIPPSLANIYDNWNYTLKLSDRGRFIMNQTIPNSSNCNNLYITVPLNENVPFPVGTVITLINSNDSNSGGYEIFVQPENYNNTNCPKIYASGYSYNSTWSFAGMQTATLMKINSNGWLLTASNVINRD